MHIVNIKKSSLLLIASFAVALLATISSAIFITSKVSAVDAISGGCVAAGGSTGLTSPYKSTPKMCIGDGQSGSGIRYYQFAITLNKAISGIKVESSAKDPLSGKTVTFVQENSTTWVSQPSPQGMGYQAGVGIGTTIGCNDKDPANLVKVTVTGPGSNNSQEIQINLCSFTGSAKSNSVISKPANNIKDASGAPTATKGTIKANLGVQRNDPMVPNKLKKSGIKKDYITSIKLSGQATMQGDNSSGWYSVDTNSNGSSILTIPSLDPGTYNLDVVYNDKPAIDAQGGDAGWTVSDVTFSFSNIVIRAGDNWVNGTSDTNVYYANSGDPNQTPTVQTVNTCVIDGIGWIVCPVVNFLAKIADGAFGFLSDTLLKTDPGIFNQSGGLYRAWVAIRNIANVAFVIAFLIIIFSQLTGIGVTNYGVKKLLPRIIVAAILVNVSFYICALAVDISNILGYSLNSLFASIGQSSLVGNSATSNTGWFSGQGFGNLAGGVLAFAAGGVLLYALLSTIVPALLAAVVALLMILLILVMRQALIILLIAIAPLAFVAYLLPNTEKWFTQWRKMFTSLLLVFPIVAVIFGASSLASSILLSSTGSYTISTVSSTASQAEQDSSNSANKMFIQLMAALVLVLPLFLVPVVLKKSLDGVNGIGAAVGKMRDRTQGLARGKAKQTYDNSRMGQWRKYRAGNWATNRALAQSGAYRGGNPLRKAQSWTNSKINQSGALGKFGERSQAAGTQMVNEQDSKDIQAAETLLSHGSTAPADLAKRMDAAIKSGDHITARAAQNMLLKTAAGREQFHDYMSRNEGSVPAAMRTRLKQNILDHHADMKGKDAAIARWGYDSRQLSEVQQYDAGNVDAKTGAYNGAYAGMSDSDLAGQRVANMREAAAAGVLTGEAAARILSTPSTSSGLSPEQRSYLNSISNATSSTQPSLSFSAQTPGADSSGASNTALSADKILSQVSASGGWEKLSDDDVYKAYEHASKTLGGVNDGPTNQLGSEAINELRRRGIIPQADGSAGGGFSVPH